MDVNADICCYFDCLSMHMSEVEINMSCVKVVIILLLSTTERVEKGLLNTMIR